MEDAILLKEGKKGSVDLFTQSVMCDSGREHFAIVSGTQYRATI